MNRSRIFHLFWIGAIIASSGCAGCKSTDSSTRYMIFLDQTASISAAQRARWATFLIENVIPAVQPGDELVIFPIHSRTRDAAPLYRRHLPSIGSTYDELLVSQQALESLQGEATSAIQQGLHPATMSRSTDILGLFDRLQSDSTFTRTVTIVCSDMLNATPELDLEKNRIDEGRVSQVVHSLEANHYWTDRTLRGISVYCLLNDASPGDPPTLNDRIRLNCFWRSLVEAMGGNMAAFETHMSLPGKGGKS